MKINLHIAIPALDELDFLPQTLAAITQQKTDFNFSVSVCVNQPDAWWNETENLEICKNNQKLLKLLKSFNEFNINIIDKTSAGNGWQHNDYGVGWARKTLFDDIMQTANDEDIIISLDADTLFNETYLQSIGENFIRNKIEALALPYYHKLTKDANANRAILRYEIYMRNYFINMQRIGSPYAFTALGSAIAAKVNVLRKIRGITPLKSGEDFYLLQKIRKMTPISNYNTEIVYPSARFSSRVLFGTGPAMIKGNNDNWSSYPIYHCSLFDKIKETYDIIPQLFTEDKETEFINFLKAQYKTEDLWNPLRKNFKTLPQFTRAFHEKADGLRILQFLKYQLQITENKLQVKDDELQITREQLFEIEMKLRKLPISNLNNK